MSAASTATLHSAASRVELASALSKAAYPDGATRVIVAIDEPGVVQIAGNLGSRIGSPVLTTTNGATSLEVLTRLKDLKATSVVKIGRAAKDFAPRFEAELATENIDAHETLSALTDFDLSVAASRFGAASPEVVLSSSDDVYGTALATSYAGTRGLPLVVRASDTPDQDLSAFFTSIGSTRLSDVGDPARSATAQMSQTQADSLHQVDTTDKLKALVWAAAQAQAAGTDSSRVLVAAQNSPDLLALSGGLARVRGSLVVPAGNIGALATDSQAASYLRLWRSTAASVTLVGLNLSQSDLSTVVQPTTVDPVTWPAFRATDFRRTSAGGFTLHVSGVVGANRYRALDFEGKTLASSTSSTLSFAGPVPSLLVVAESGSRELARFDFRSNDYSSDALRVSAMTATVNNGSANLHFLGPKLPRLITRVMSNPFDMASVPAGETPVAITCGPTWTDSGLDKSKEYEYAASALTNVSVTACDRTMPTLPATSEPFDTARVAVPFTQIPAGAPAGSVPTGTGRSNSSAPGAHPTVFDSMIASAMSEHVRPDNSHGASKVLGDGWSDFLFRWQAYIPEGKVLFPGYSGDLGKPQLAFHGDGHGTYQPNGSSRFTQDLRFKFGSKHDIAYSETMGETLKYKCALWLRDCTVIDRATAPLSQLNWTKASSQATSGQAKLRAQATIPLVNIAPPIDTDISVTFGLGTSRLSGYHDKMPRHEAYVGVPGSEWFRIYQSPYVGYAQLPCLYSSPSKPIPGCGVRLNVQL